LPKGNGNLSKIGNLSLAPVIFCYGRRMRSHLCGRRKRGLFENMAKTSKTAKTEKTAKTIKTEKTNKTVKTVKTVKTEKTDKTDKTGRNRRFAPRCRF
jgi:hypothetical protein